mgnify:CR=1 FL=1
MSTFINTEIQVEDIIAAMNEDANFCQEMWLTLADYLNMGLLLDNSCDVICNDAQKSAFIAASMKQFASSIESGCRAHGTDMKV